MDTYSLVPIVALRVIMGGRGATYCSYFEVRSASRFLWVWHLWVWLRAWSIAPTKDSPKVLLYIILWTLFNKRGHPLYNMLGPECVHYSAVPLHLVIFNTPKSSEIQRSG